MIKSISKCLPMSKNCDRTLICIVESLCSVLSSFLWLALNGRAQMGYSCPRVMFGSSFYDFNCVDVVMRQWKPYWSLATHFALHSWNLCWTASWILACCRLTNCLLLTEQTPWLTYMLEICPPTHKPVYNYRCNRQKKMQWMKTEYAGKKLFMKIRILHFLPKLV